MHSDCKVGVEEKYQTLSAIQLLISRCRSSTRSHNKWDFLTDTKNHIIQNLPWYHCWSEHYWKLKLGRGGSHIYCEHKGLGGGLHPAHEGDFWFWSVEEVDFWSRWSTTFQVCCQRHVWRLVQWTFFFFFNPLNPKMEMKFSFVAPTHFL